MPKSPKNTNHKPVNKTQLVLGMPRTLSAAEVVAAAKAKGIKITDKQVYVIRSKAKARKAKRRGRGRPARSAASVGAAPAFAALALDLGLARAEALRGGLRRQIKEVVLR